MKRLFCLFCVMFAGAGCGGDGSSPKEFCSDFAEVTCARSFECYSAEERTAMGFPVTEAACVTQLETFLGCSAITEDSACDGNETFHASAAADCNDQLGSASCGQIRAGDDSAAPACGEVCVTE
jgi:hypothetical protein